MSLSLVRRAAALLALAVLPLAAQAPSHVILVTLDGVRTQEFFGGLDTLVLNGTERQHNVGDPAALRRRWWRPTPEERRRLLMPFFWDSLAPQGLVLGNVARGNQVLIQNPMRFSAPGYLDMFTGQAQPDVTSNDQKRYGHVTVLEHARRALGLAREQVALFGSWENFRWYAASDSTAVVVNAGSQAMEPALETPRTRELARLERRAQPIWHEARLDVFTGAMALEYLRTRHPRLMVVNFDDTDDLSHLRRYEPLLVALGGLDDFLHELWTTVQSDPRLRGRTTLIITTDHGRGRTPEDWSNHGEDVEGAQEIWLAVIGPGTAAVGEPLGVTGVQQAAVAGTILRCLGLDPAGLAGAAPPVPGTCREAR